MAGSLHESSVAPVSARSAVLSLLLGTHPPAMTARDVVAAMDLVGVSEQATRVALTRMVAAGDLLRRETTYALAQRLVDRQRRQDAAVRPRVRPWDGRWELVVVTASGRSPADRAELRTRLAEARLAELREGVWMRPANLDREADPGATRALRAHLAPVARTLMAEPVEDAAALAASLWDLEAWSRRGHELLEVIERTDDSHRRFSAMAMTVRHLLADPVLPDELVPGGWPGGALRSVYADYRHWLVSMRPDHLREPAGQDLSAPLTHPEPV